MSNFCEQYDLPLIAPSRQKGKKHDKIHKNYNHKKYRNNIVKRNDFYAKKKHVSKKYDKKKSGKGNALIVENLVTTVKIANKNLVS